GAVCLVLVSGPYEESEYIREYDDFRLFNSSKN
ncbi:MAG: FdtA/QdtA family cupin domain-containing protein, partial [Muribaculaceae bacterium]|nr:FdtA/QdtA family cupin domain-containing protein [Muribaculaceae bacterium]